MTESKEKRGMMFYKNKQGEEKPQETGTGGRAVDSVSRGGAYFIGR